MAIPYHMQRFHANESRFGSGGLSNDAASLESDAEPGDGAIQYVEYEVAGEGLESFARITLEGRITVSLNLKKKLPDLPQDHANQVAEFAVDQTQYARPPRLNIVIMIVGSRGDVQPFLALGRRLKEYGHRVRIATHETFRHFVKECGLDFFCIGGDPKDLMSYMVKNPGLIPGIDSIMNGDIGRKRKMISDVLDGCWRACHEPDESKSNFIADAIISNPPSFAHVHCAEALGIPLLLTFTMPWCPTTAFPHPLVNVKHSNAERGLTNYLSYPLADILSWQGLGDVINRLRTRTLGLKPLNLISGPGLTDRIRVPWTYCFSPALICKPDDWKNHIDVVGFYFLELGTSFKPNDDLETFLAAGPPPIYIGFGSVTVEDPVSMTRTIFEAVERAGVRALISEGWGGLGGTSRPENIFILGNVPHDWLFPKVSAVCHHGGAGTTAIGIRMGKPTIIVPFFGDQPFWGMMVHKAGAGPEPIPHTKLNVENLTKAIQFAISPEARVAAERLGMKIRDEDGISAGVESFYRHLPLLNMRCDLDPSRVSVWFSATLCLRLSAFAAQVLSDANMLDLAKLDLHRSKEYSSTSDIIDPVTGGASAIFWTITNYYASIAKIFYSPVKGIIQTTTAIPIGIMKMITSVHEGFRNAPRLYGSEVRESEKVTGLKSGIKAGGKALFHGYWDGITGLVREPMEGAKKEGFKGALKGAGRSWINATVRPAAGVIGVIAYPIHGAWIAGQNILAPKEVLQQRSIRIADGVEAVRGSNKEDRDEVISRFKSMTSLEETVARKTSYTENAKTIFRENFQKPTSPETNSRVSPDSSTPILTQEFDEEQSFQRDLDHAIRLSLTEQHNDERTATE